MKSLTMLTNLTLAFSFLGFSTLARAEVKCESAVNDVLKTMNISTMLTPGPLSEKAALTQGERVENDYSPASYTYKTDEWIAALKKAYQKDRYLKGVKNMQGPAYQAIQSDIDAYSSEHWLDVQKAALQDRKVTYDKTVTISGSGANSGKPLWRTLKTGPSLVIRLKVHRIKPKPLKSASLKNPCNLAITIFIWSTRVAPIVNQKKFWHFAPV